MFSYTGPPVNKQSKVQDCRVCHLRTGCVLRSSAYSYCVLCVAVDFENGQRNNIKIPVTYLNTSILAVSAYNGLNFNPFNVQLILSLAIAGFRTQEFCIANDCDAKSELYRKGQLLHRKMRCDTGYFEPCTRHAPRSMFTHQK